MNAVSIEDEKSPLPEGPGSQLRKVRQERGLELAHVASQLHLSQDVLAAIEAGMDEYTRSASQSSPFA